MEIIQIAGLCITAVIVISVIKPHRPELAIQISILVGIIVFVMISGKIASVLNLLKDYSNKAGIDIHFFSVMMKIVGIAYITEFGAEICRDSGENSIASKIELAGKVIIVVLAVPIITSLLELIIKIMP